MSWGRESTTTSSAGNCPAAGKSPDAHNAVRFGFLAGRRGCSAPRTTFNPYTLMLSKTSRLHPHFEHGSRSPNGRADLTRHADQSSGWTLNKARPAVPERLNIECNGWSGCSKLAGKRLPGHLVRRSVRLRVITRQVFPLAECSRAVTDMTDQQVQLSGEPPASVLNYHQKRPATAASIKPALAHQRKLWRTRFGLYAQDVWCATAFPSATAPTRHVVAKS